MPSAEPILPGSGRFILPGPARAADPTVLTSHQSAFAAAMGKQLSSHPDADQTPEQRAREAAEQLVTQSFVLPLLKQMRETDHTAPPFAPSQAEKQFRALGDAGLAQQIVHAARFPLVDRLARDLLKRGGQDVQGHSVDAALKESKASAPTATPNPIALPTSSPGVSPVARSH
jgi:Rod binding domain-containing protein